MIRPVLMLRMSALVLIAAIIAACGAARAPGASQIADDPLTLHFAFPDDPANVAASEALIKAYMAANPSIKITPQALPASNYAQQLLTSLSSGGPDLFVSADTQLPALIKHNALLDVQPLLRGTAQLSLDDFQPAAVESWRRGSALYGLPVDVVPQVLFFNRDMFEANGVPTPTPGWTWDDWLDASKKLTVSSGDQVTRYGTALAAWSLMVWGNGGELLDAGGNRTLLDSPEAAAGVQFAADMVNIHQVAPPPELAGGPDPVSLFREQRVAMLPAASSLAADLLEAKLPFSWEIAPLPIGRVAASPLSVAGMAVSAGSANPQAAVAFAAWAAGPDGNTVKANVQPFVAPALRSAAARSTQIKGAEAIVQALQHGRTLPQVEQWPKIAELVNQALVPVWQGKTRAADAYRQATPQINALLAG